MNEYPPASWTWVLLVKSPNVAVMMMAEFVGTSNQFFDVVGPMKVSPQAGVAAQAMKRAVAQIIGLIRYNTTLGPAPVNGSRPGIGKHLTQLGRQRNAGPDASCCRVAKKSNADQLRIKRKTFPNLLPRAISVPVHWSPKKRHGKTEANSRSPRTTGNARKSGSFGKLRACSPTTTSKRGLRITTGGPATPRRSRRFGSARSFMKSAPLRCAAMTMKWGSVRNS